MSIGIDEDGRIVAIRKILRGEETFDHGDAVILPGCVDIHVHFRDPGLTHKEDFASGTRSAALGGVTTVAEMPNTVPPVVTVASLAEKIARLRGRAAVDYVLYAAPRSGASVPRLAEAAGWKIYMAESTGGLQLDVETAREIFAAAESFDKPVIVHAEDPAKFRTDGARGLEGYAIARPKEAEVSALEILEKIRSRARIHIAHLTCVEALNAAPQGVSTEVTPHHLFLDVSRPIGAMGKVNPPLRSRDDRDALWDAFRAGRIDVVASDHAPHTIEEKDEPFDEAPAGLPGVATTFPLLMRRAKAGDLELSRLVSAIAARPAEILGLPKGRIEIGADADLIVVDPRRIETVSAKRVRYKCGWTSFEGMEGVFPGTVYLRGEPIVEGSQATAEGQGRLARMRQA